VFASVSVSSIVAMAMVTLSPMRAWVTSLLSSIGGVVDEAANDEDLPTLDPVPSAASPSHSPSSPPSHRIYSLYACVIV